MKPSELFKILALTSVGAFVVSKVKEDTQLFGNHIQPEEKVKILIDRLQKKYNLSPMVSEVAKNSIDNYHRVKFNKAKPIKVKKVY